MAGEKQAPQRVRALLAGTAGEGLTHKQAPADLQRGSEEQGLVPGQFPGCPEQQVGGGGVGQDSSWRSA